MIRFLITAEGLMPYFSKNFTKYDFIKGTKMKVYDLLTKKVTSDGKNWNDVTIAE
jgi:hypothetical protein